MTEEQRQRVREVFLAALEAAPGARAGIVENLCGGDSEVRAEVESLLAHDPGGATFLGTPVLGDSGALLSGLRIEARELPADTLGPYRIVEALGEGGFGAVYLAEQSEPIRRRVALKVLKPGMDSRQVLARFEAERQALALMDHPNVARVFDAGRTPVGRPYFVMEYVRGEPLTAYCDRLRRDVRRRLGLFAMVCDAVQHAHGKGVIHRDLKPGNILVEEIDGVAVPKVIDFGVAKAVASPLTDRPLHTERGQLVGTPEYMSPEQADLEGSDVDTRSDVYSLGVVLYELLTGSLPFSADALRSGGLDTIQRLIRGTDPPRPSTRLSSMAGGPGEGRAGRGENASGSGAPGPELRNGSLAVVAAARGTEARALVRAVRTDLDWIVMKCLEKDRSRRYDTAHALALDVRRYLSHEPVLARPPSAAYRFGKVARRHRLAFAMAGVAVVLLLAGTAVSAWQAVRAYRAGEAERVAAEKARTQAAIALAVNRFLNQDLLGAADPERYERGRTLTVREALDTAAGTIEGRFADQPLVEAAVRLTLGQTYNSLGEYSAAEPQTKAALEIRRAHLGGGDVQTLEAEYAHAISLMNLDRMGEAEPSLVRVFEQRRAVLGEAHEETLAAQVSLGILSAERDRFEEAIGLLAAAREIAGRGSGKGGRVWLNATDRLASAYGDAGRLAEAEPLLVEVLAIRRSTQGDGHPETALTCNNLGLLYVNLGRYAEARALLEEASGYYRARFGEDHAKSLRAMTNLAICLRGIRKLDEAGELFALVLERRRRTLGENHIDTLSATNNLGSLYRLQERHDLAEPLFRAAYEASSRLAGPEDTNTLSMASNLALTWQTLGRHADADRLYREILPGARRAFPPGHWALGVILTYHGEGMTRLGEFEGAESVLLEAHQILSSGLGATHERTLKAVGALVALFDATGRTERAEEWRARLSSGTASSP